MGRASLDPEILLRRLSRLVLILSPRDSTSLFISSSSASAREISACKRMMKFDKRQNAKQDETVNVVERNLAK